MARAKNPNYPGTWSWYVHEAQQDAEERYAGVITSEGLKALEQAKEAERCKS